MNFKLIHFSPFLLTKKFKDEGEKMRKAVLCIMAATAALSLGACTKTDKKQTTQARTTEAQTTEAQTTQAQTTEAVTTEVQTTEVQTTEAQTSEAVPTFDSELVEILDKIYAIKMPEFAFDSVAIDLNDEYYVSNYTGLTLEDIEKVDAVLVSEPMMSSQAYSLVLVRVKDAKDTEEIAQKMADGINPRKWVCVEANDMQVVSKDNMIMLVMVDSELSISSKEAVDAFTEVVGKPDKTYEAK